MKKPPERRRPKMQNEQLDLLIGMSLTGDKTGRLIHRLRQYPGNKRDVEPLILANRLVVTFLVNQISDLYDDLAKRLAVEKR